MGQNFSIWLRWIMLSAFSSGGSKSSASDSGRTRPSTLCSGGFIPSPQHLTQVSHYPQYLAWVIQHLKCGSGGSKLSASGSCGSIPQHSAQVDKSLSIRVRGTNLSKFCLGGSVPLTLGSGGTRLSAFASVESILRMWVRWTNFLDIGSGGSISLTH